MKQKRLERRVADERAKIIGLGEAPNPTPHYHLALCLMTAICLQRYSMTEKELWALMDKMGLQKSTQVITSIRTTNKLAGKCTACVAARNLACGWVAKESGKSPRSSNTQFLLRNGVTKAWESRQALDSGPWFLLHHRVPFPALSSSYFICPQIFFSLAAESPDVRQGRGCGQGDCCPGVPARQKVKGPRRAASGKKNESCNQRIVEYSCSETFVPFFPDQLLPGPARGGRGDEAADAQLGRARFRRENALIHQVRAAINEHGQTHASIYVLLPGLGSIFLDSRIHLRSTAWLGKIFHL